MNNEKERVLVMQKNLRLSVEKDLEHLIAERDYWESKATRLAEKAGEFHGLDFGEHTSQNCPATEAIIFFSTGC